MSGSSDNGRACVRVGVLAGKAQQANHASLAYCCGVYGSLIEVEACLRSQKAKTQSCAEDIFVCLSRKSDPNRLCVRLGQTCSG